MTTDQVLTALLGAGGLALVTLWAVWVGFRQASSLQEAGRSGRSDTTGSGRPGHTPGGAL